MALGAPRVRAEFVKYLLAWITADGLTEETTRRTRRKPHRHGLSSPPDWEMLRTRRRGLLGYRAAKRGCARVVHPARDLGKPPMDHHELGRRAPLRAGGFGDFHTGALEGGGLARTKAMWDSCRWARVSEGNLPPTHGDVIIGEGLRATDHKLRFYLMLHSGSLGPGSFEGHPPRHRDRPRRGHWHELVRRLQASVPQFGLLVAACSRCQPTERLRRAESLSTPTPARQGAARHGT